MANRIARVAGLGLLAAVVTAASLSEQSGGDRATAAATAPYEAVVSHLAGPAAGPGYADGVAATARFALPWGVAVDGAGNTFVADSANHTIRKITPAGDVTTIAGLSGNPGSADGPGADARFRLPTGVASGPGGVLYVCDSGNHTIRRVAADGDVSTLAGSPGTEGFADGSGADARFSRPLRAVVDDAGNLLVADTGNHVIRLVTPAGVVTTPAGVPGQPGSADGAAAQAQFRDPSGLVVQMGSAGVEFWVADAGNHTVRFADQRDTVATYAGSAGHPGSDDGPRHLARFDNPRDVARAFDLGLVVADTGNHTIRWLKGPGGTATLAGEAGGPGFADGAGAAARFFAPHGIAAAAATFRVADTGNHAIRSVTEGGATTTLAGSAALPGAADGAAADARFRSPSGIEIAGDTALVADSGNNTIRAIDAAGAVATLAGAAGQSGSADGAGDTARFNAPYAIVAATDGALFVTDRGNHTVRRIAPDTIVSTFAGSPGEPGIADGAGAAARFSGPAGLALAVDGTLYVADTGNHTIRAITATGEVSTLAGAAGTPGGADGSGATARFDRPTGLCVHPRTGEILVADRGNGRVRRVTPAGLVSTLAVPGPAGVAPVELSDPVGVAVDSLGNIFVSEEENHRMALVRPSGEVLSFAGAAGTPGNVDGGGAAARLFLPREIAAGPQGTLLVAEAGNHDLRTIAYDYVAGECFPPAIADRTEDRLATGGESVTVSVFATGTPPFTYQWYSGERGDTTSPIAGATGDSYTTPALAATTKVWARVGNGCGSADGGTITLTVCAYALSPAAATFTHLGGGGSVTVTTDSPCQWTATASTEWITFPSGSSGTGPATLAYAVAPNPGAARSATITVGGQAHEVTQSLFPRYFVSSVAHLPGANRTRWRTDLAVVNRKAAEASLTLTFWPYGAGDQVVKTHTLAAGATVEWKDVLVSLFESPESAAIKGSVQIDASGPVLISSRTYNQAAGGTYGQGYPAIIAPAALAAGVTGVIPQLVRTAALRTNIGVLNVGVADVKVAITLFNAAGAQTGTTKEATVPPARFWQQDDIFTAVGAGEQEGAYATVEVLTAGGLVWAYGSVIDNGTGDPTTVPVQFGVPPGPYLVSSQAHLKGIGGTQWRSALAIVNGGAAEAGLTLTYWPYGSGAAVVRDHTLAAGATVEWQDVLVSLFGQDPAANVKGSVEVAATQPAYVGARTYNQVSRGTFGQSYPAVAEAQALLAGQLGVLPQLKRSAAARTNIGVQNLGDSDVGVEVRLFDAGGTQVGAVTTATVAASRYWQQDDIFVSAAAGQHEIAYATVALLTPGGKVWAYASVIDAATGDPTTVPVLVQ